jgi:hypothetical protein
MWIKSVILAFILLTLQVGKSIDISGLYGKCENGYLVCEQLLLKEDNTFKYALFYDVGGWRVWEGKFFLKKDTIVLNTYDQPDYKLNSILETKIQDSVNKIIQVYNIDVPATNAEIDINDGELLLKLDFGGYIKIPNSVKLKKIKIHNTNWTDCSLEDSVFIVKNENSNYIEIHTKPFNNYLSEYFVDTKWIIKGRKIFIWRKWNGEFSKKRILKKNNLKYLQFE